MSRRLLITGAWVAGIAMWWRLGCFVDKWFINTFYGNDLYGWVGERSYGWIEHAFMGLAVAILMAVVLFCMAVVLFCLCCSVYKYVRWLRGKP